MGADSWSSYPTYEEWKPLYFNMNIFHWMKSSYPTYEEWKHAIINGVKSVINYVLILPMRNGNFHCKTSDWFLITVLILPMRNGNVICQPSPVPEIMVLILPMRNGNGKWCVWWNVYYKFLSYLWGMETLRKWQEDSHLFRWVLILPMRNGNSTPFLFSLFPFTFLSYLWGMETLPIQVYIVLHCQVLILPMRNGNFSSNAIPTRDALFLSYLWGMETIFLFLLVLPYILRSYPTYEEWKLWSLI